MAYYELWVLCRREPPAPPSGWGERVWGIDTVRSDVDQYLAIDNVALDAFACQIYLKSDASRPTGSITELARGIADAGDGIVVHRLPVTIPARFRIIHTGVPVDAPAWDAVEQHIKRTQPP